MTRLLLILLLILSHAYAECPEVWEYEIFDWVPHQITANRLGKEIIIYEGLVMTEEPATMNIREKPIKEMAFGELMDCFEKFKPLPKDDEYLLPRHHFMIPEYRSLDDLRGYKPNMDYFHGLTPIYEPINSPCGITNNVGGFPPELITGMEE